MNVKTLAAKAAILAIVVPLGLMYGLGRSYAAQSEADTISDTLQGYLVEWNEAPDTDIPPTDDTERALSEIWKYTISGSECERFAGAAMGIVALMGEHQQTGDAAYLGGALIILDNIDAIEYACLIEA